MGERWREWCGELRDDEVEFEVFGAISWGTGYGWSGRRLDEVVQFDCRGYNLFRIPNQEFPDKIKDKEAWMHKWKERGLKVASCIDYENYGRKVWKIFEQNIPKQWTTEQPKEENKMSKPTPEQIKKQKLEWIADYEESATNDAPMREWEFKDGCGKWYRLKGSIWALDNCECRRTAETYTFYWCVVQGSSSAWIEWRRAEAELQDVIQDSPSLLKQLTPIKKETVELTEITK